MFANKQKGIRNIYCTAGFPKLDDTISVMHALQLHGADMIELGMPYSDPLADGPVIQSSSAKAIENGMTIQKLFEQLEDFRNTITIPVVLMGYMNPVLQYGFEKFCFDAKAKGIDGLIIPDLPLIEFKNTYQKIITEHDLDFIFLVTPETPEERVRELDSMSTGFLYAVTSSSITGSNNNFSQVDTYLQRLKSYELRNPILVGFGVKDKQSFQSVCHHTNGAIIGSAYIEALQNDTDISVATATFLNGIGINR